MSEAVGVDPREIQTVSVFEILDEALENSGPNALIDELLVRLDERGEYRALLDAMLLKARHDLGLPLIADGDSSRLPEPVRTQFEERYVDAIRTVGTKLLAIGDIPGAWPYFRTIGEPEPITGALEAYTPALDDERLGPIIEVAFNQGANPRKGFELILETYGTCSAITAFEHLPRDESVRVPSADRLVRHLRDQIIANLRAEIAQRGQPLSSEESTIPELLAGREWLFADEAYHIDVSHLSSVVRMSPLLTNMETIGLAVELTDYGRKLSGRHTYDGESPFERIYEDHATYLRGILGKGNDADIAIAHFKSKLVSNEPDSLPDSTPAQVLVSLLVRINRLEEAIEIAAKHLAGIPESSLFCPGVAQLCQRLGRPDRLAKIARDRGDLVYYTAAILQGASPEDGRAKS